MFLEHLDAQLILPYLHFFLWIYLKGTVYINIPRNLTTEREHNSKTDILKKVMETVVQRMRFYQNNNCGYLRDIMFKYKLQNFLFRLQLTRRFYLS